MEWEPSLLLAAIHQIDEERLERYRVSAYPVFLQYGKKGETWSQFQHKLGLGEKSTAANKPKKLTRAALDALYHKAEAIKRMHLRKD